LQPFAGVCNLIVKAAILAGGYDKEAKTIDRFALRQAGFSLAIGLFL